MLLFCTIHYGKPGFSEILRVLKKRLPTKTVIVGGTVTGFFNHDGVFVRGLAAVAFGGQIRTATSIGRNVKRNPDAAAEDFAVKLEAKGYQENGVLFETTSNGVVPSLPLLGTQRVMQIPHLNDAAIKAFEVFNFITQTGVGREDAVFDAVAARFPRSTILAVSSYDDNQSLANYQFIAEETATNAVTGIGIWGPFKAKVRTEFGLNPTDITLELSKKNFHGCSFGEVNGKPATQGIMRALGWPETYFDRRIYRRTYYYPLTTEKDGKIYPHVMGLFLGKHVCCTYSFKEDKARVYTTSGEDILRATDKLLQDVTDGTRFGLGVICTSILEALGSNMYSVQERFSSKFGPNAFLVVFGAGEGAYDPERGGGYFNSSLNLLTLEAETQPPQTGG